MIAKKSLPKKDQVKATDNSTIYLSFYLCMLLAFYFRLEP